MAYVAQVKDIKNLPEKNEKWMRHHNECIRRQDEICDVVMYGSSNIARFGDKWCVEFGRKVVNFAYGGDRIQQCLYRLQEGRIPKCAQLIVVHIGTNNVPDDTADRIASGLHQICSKINEIRPDLEIILTGLLPGKDRPVKKIKTINHKLHDMFQGRRAAKMRVRYLKPTMADWTIRENDGTMLPNPDLFKDDGVHLTPAGYKLFISYVQKISEKTSVRLVPLNVREGLSEDPLHHLSVMNPEPVDALIPALWDVRLCPGGRHHTGTTYDNVCFEREMQKKRHYRRARSFNQS